MSDRNAAIEAAIVRLTAEQFTQDGKPSVDAINEHLEAEDLDPITAEERDTLWAERVTESEDAGPMDTGLGQDSDGGTDEGDRTTPPSPEIQAMESAPEGEVEITLLSAPSEPLPLHVHGVGSFSLRVGQTYRLPAEAVAALRDSDAKFTTA